MKYYLLTFDEDYADEHDVPALACMTEEEYKKWLKTPSGELNPKYEKQRKEKEEHNKKWDDFWKLLTDKGYTLNGSANTSKIPKEDKETLKLEKELRALKNPPYSINKVNSNMRAYLGNSGEGFEEAFSNYYLMEEFVEGGEVTVMEVDKSFYDTFHKAELDKLSMCNVFTVDNY